MSTAYWSQWDKKDLDSWQGKDFPLSDFDDLDIDFELDEEEEEESCSFGCQCINCLGFSCRDFM